MPRHAAHLRQHPVLRVIAMTLTGVLCLGGAAAATAYRDLSADIEVSDVDALLGDRTDRPTLAPDNPDDPFAGKVLNILVMGTDYRGAGNDALAGAGDEFHSDSTLVVHVSGDRSRVEVVSIPRDSLVDIPSCPLPGGGNSKPRRDAMFNEAFTIGGGPHQDVTGAAACTILTVEALTGIPITNHIVVEMTGVIGVVDALGGVPMCLPEPVKGEKVDLDLPAGRHVFTGYEAINFLRARHGKGMGLDLGSDLSRIKRQQAFIDSMLREVLAQNVITDSPRLYKIVSAVLKSISPDKDLASPKALAGLAWSLKSVDPAQIVFTPLPVVDSTRKKYRVEWVTAETDKIWQRIIADQAPGSDAATPPAGGGSTPAQGTTSAPPAATQTPAGGASAPAATAPAPSPSPSLLPGVCAP